MGLTLLTALALRLASLHSFLTIDEQLWALRARRFAQALRTGNLADTYQAHHPGVVTMWLGAASIALGIDGGGDLAGIVFGARWLVALVNWAGLSLMCLLIARLFGRRVALVAALLIGLDPFTLALSRLLHLDALLTTFATLSLLALLLYLRSRGLELRWLLLSALCTALASLSKSPGLLLVPFGAVLILAWSLWERQCLRVGWQLLLWGLVVALVGVALWPALWVAPGETLAQVWEGILGQGLAPHENENFFLGHPTADPGPLFYPVAWLFRTTPWVLLGLAISPFAPWPPPASGPPHRDHRAMVGALVLFVLLFSALMTLGAKKFDRYLLPIFPTMGLMAARGLVQLGQRMRGHRQPLGLAVLVVSQLVLALFHHPYYLSYYNPLVGGTLTAPWALLVGWGEGMEQAAAYLNAKEHGPDLRVTAWYEPPLAPFLRGEASVLSEADYSTDYFVFYINELQRDPSRAQRYCLPQGPETVIRPKGIDYAWICSTDQARQPLIEYLQEHVASQDVILLSRPAPRLEPRLPPGGLSAGGDALSALRQLEESDGRLWYVHEPYEVRPVRMIDQQVAARCRKLEEAELPLAHVRLYQLPPLSPFGPAQLDRPQGVDFGKELHLLRAGLIAPQLDFRQQVGVALEWFSPEGVQRDLKIAWRVRDARGESWSGLDRLLVDEEDRRTSHWQTGTYHLTRHLISLLPGLPPGPYSLNLTLYHEPTMEQLPYRESGGTWQPTSYTLADLEVVPCPIPPALEELDIPEPQREPLADGLTLLGFTPWPESVRPGEDLPVELFWEAEEKAREDWAVNLQLQDAAGQEVASIRATIGGPQYPTSRWPREERIRARYQLPILASTDPGGYSLLVSAGDGAHGTSSASEPIPLGQVMVQGRAHQFTPPEIAHPQEALLGQEVALLGYDLTRTRLSPGEEMEVTLYWQARGEMSTSYTVFVHLLDRDERIWGQRDSQPGEGAWPTTGWVSGEVLADRYIFQVQQNAPSGEYRLEVGMYDAATGDRLPAFDTQGERLPGDRILLADPIIVRS